MDPGFDDDSALVLDTDVAGSDFPGVTTDPIVLATLYFAAGEPGIVELSIAFARRRGGFAR